MHEHGGFLPTLTIVLCVAAATTVVFQRLRQPVVLGYLLAGMVVGPYVPVPLVADEELVRTLAELGVVLLMFSLGIEFSLPKLSRVGFTAAFTAVFQCSVMIWIGASAAELFGWSRTAGLYAGAVIAISSTTIIVKAFEEQRVKGAFTQVVFGVLIVEDLIAVVLLTMLTSLSSGASIDAATLAGTFGKLVLFLGLLLIGGVLAVPPIMRAVVRLDRPETTVIAGVGTAFGGALLATRFGYSGALGAFLAGSLVAESGVETTIEQSVRPVRDIFAAVFFVSVGMSIDPAQIVAHWPVVLTFLIAVTLGKIGSVSVAALLTGQSVQNAVKTGMSLAQIGEFSFIIAGLGIATGVTDGLLFSVAAAVSGITTLLTPWLIRGAEPTAAFIDRKLPRAFQTFLALYGGSLRQAGTAPRDGRVDRLRRLALWLAVDACFVAGSVIGLSLKMDTFTEYVSSRTGASSRTAAMIVVAATLAVSSPFWIGMLRVVRFLAAELAERVFPPGRQGDVDLAAAPRRLLIVAAQSAIVLLVGAPLVAITQPFLPPLRGALLLALIVGYLAFVFRRQANDFQGHARAAAQVVAEALIARTREDREASMRRLEDVHRVVVGLGSPVPIPLPDEGRAVGKTLAEIRLRGLTGATVLAIQRGTEAVLIPTGHERLLAGDVLAVAGTPEAVEAARRLLSDLER